MVKASNLVPVYPLSFLYNNDGFSDNLSILAGQIRFENIIYCNN